MRVLVSPAGASRSPSFSCTDTHTACYYAPSLADFNSRHSWPDFQFHISRLVHVIGESNVYIDVAGNMSTEQTHLCGLWKRWRRSSINNKRSLSPRRMPSKKGIHLYKYRAPIIYNQPAPNLVNAQDVGQDEKGGIHTQACSAGRCHRYISGSRKAYDSIVDDIVDDLLPRRCGSQSHKTFAPTLGASDLRNDQVFHLKRDILPRQNLQPNLKTKLHDTSESRIKKWFRRCIGSKYPHQRRPSAAPYAHYNAPLQIDHCPAPIPGIGVEPPIIPDDPTSGAAARAAAATQNEILEFVRNLKLVEVRMDAESGIGIEMQNKPEEIINAPIPRKGIYMDVPPPMKDTNLADSGK